MEHGSGDLYDFINSNCPQTFRTFLIIAIQLLLFLFFYKSSEDYYLQEISKKDELLKEESKIIWKKYHDLHNYRTQEILIDTINKLLSTEEYILSIQFYNYEIMHDDNVVTFKIKYETGSVKEKYSINSMMQHYYYISSKFYEKFYLALLYFDKGDIEHLLRFISDVKTHLRNKKIDKLTEEDSFHFELLQFAIEYMIEGPAVYDNIIEPSKLEKLSQLNRLGIIRGIINKDFYFFRNLHNNHKKDRIYMTRAIKFNSKNYILLFSVNQSIKRNFDDYTLEVGQICDKFIEDLSNFVEIKYND